MPAPRDAKAAVEQLMRQHAPQVRALALRLCATESDADDAVQESFLTAYRKWHTFKGESKPSTWLYTIAVRICRRHLRRTIPRRKRTLALDAGLPTGSAPLATPPDDGPVPRAIRAEALDALQSRIAELPEHFRVPLVLKDVLELPIADVAAALAIKPETVKTRVHRARLLLRSALDGRIPSKRLPPPAYQRQVCLDLLAAKQAALDSGRGFPLGDSIICDRCRAVFKAMDLARDTCARMASGDIPASLRRQILGKLAAACPQSAHDAA